LADRHITPPAITNPVIVRENQRPFKRLERSITQGIVNAVYSDYLQFQAPISNGNSGGPLLDIHGQVIGIVTMGLLTSQGAPVVQNLNFALPVSAIPLHRPKND
jgi:S1-C subfamily serine protease